MTDRLDAVTEDLSGQRVGLSYRLTELIGSGATGAVWRALDVEHGVEKAVKLLHDELMRQPKAVTRFVQERAILQMLHHPNIVRVHGLLTVGESLGLVMDLVHGGSLRDYLRKHRTLRVSEAARLLGEVADALAEAHRNGVVHRDLKPDNVLLDQDGERATTRLTDFGVARLLDNSGFTTSGAMVGTANYLAPETIYGGKATPAVDVYAIGIVLYELLTGRPPYSGGPAWAILRRHVERSPEPVAGMPPSAWRVILACMDRRPGRRPTAEELVVTLRTLARTTAGVPALSPTAAAPNDSSTFDPDETSVARDGAPPARSGTPIDRSGALGVHVGVAGGRDGASADRGRKAGDPDETSVASALERSITLTAAGRDRYRDAAPVPAQRGWKLHPRSTMFVVVLLAVLATAFGVPALKLIDGAGRATVGEPRTKNPSRGVAAAGRSGAAHAPSAAVSSVPNASAAAGQPQPRSPEPGLKIQVGDPTARPVEVVAYGPWQCGGVEYHWDVGHPVLAKPCHSTGSGIRVIGHMQALPGIQVDVTLSLVDADSGATVSGPFECDGMMFTDFAPSHDCGFFEVGPSHGRRLVVTEAWQYTGRGALPSGTVRGVEFDW